MCPNGKWHYILGGVSCCFPVPHLAIALLYLPSLSCIYQFSSLFFFLLSFTTPGLFFLSSRLCLNIFVAFPSSSSSPSCPTFLYISLPASAALIAINSPSETLTCGLLLLWFLSDLIFRSAAETLFRHNMSWENSLNEHQERKGTCGSCFQFIMSWEIHTHVSQLALYTAESVM